MTGTSRSLARNAAALFSGQAIGLIAPLITVPYLARVLRPEGWAPVLAAQALANWLVLVLEYGFDLSGTREIARVRHEPSFLPAVVRDVQSAKLLLIPFAFAVLVVAFVAVPVLRPHLMFAPWILAIAVCRGLSPFWFFQGIERVHGAAIVDATARGLAAAGVFVFVRDPADGWKVLALQAVFAALALGVLMMWMSRETVLVAPGVQHAIATLRRSWNLFAYRAAGGLYNQASALMLGMVGTLLQVATFGGADRIIRAAISLLQPLTQAFFPRVTSLRASNPAEAMVLVRRSLIGVGLFGAVMGIVAFVAAPLLVTLILGDGYEGVIPLLRALSVLPPLVAVNTVLCLYWALPFGHERKVLHTVVVAAVVNIALMFVLVPRAGAVGMCIAVIASEVLVTVMIGTLFLRSRNHA